MNRSYGRLTLTPQRLIFRVGWAAKIFFFFAPPRRVGPIEVDLNMVSRVDRASVGGRVVWDWMSALPGMTTTEITLKNDQRIRFAAVPEEQWERALGDLQERYPDLIVGPVV